MKSIIIIFLSVFALNIIPFLLLKLFKIKIERLSISIGIVNIVFSFLCILYLYDCIRAVKDIYDKPFLKEKLIISLVSIFFILFNILYIYTYQKIRIYNNIISFLCFCLFIMTVYNFFKYLPYKKYETIELEIDKESLMPAPLFNFIINITVSLLLILIIKINRNR